MADLISRAVAIKAFTGKPPEYYHTSYIVAELKVIPAVDAVPVVRCKDLHHHFIDLYADQFRHRDPARRGMGLLQTGRYDHE